MADKWQNKDKAASHDKGRNKKAHQKLEEWRKRHEAINVLRKAYQEKIPGWVVKSMEFEKEPLSMARLNELLEIEKTSSDILKERRMLCLKQQENA